MSSLGMQVSAVTKPGSEGNTSGPQTPQANDSGTCSIEAVRGMLVWNGAWYQWSGQDRPAVARDTVRGGRDLVAAELRDHPGLALHFSGLTKDGSLDGGHAVRTRAAAGRF